MTQEIENIIQVRLDGDKWMLDNEFLRKDQIMDVKSDIEFCEKLLTMLGVVAASNEWISVDERLPDIYGDYLTTTDHGRILVRRFDTGINVWIGNPFSNVTHWMNLPNPPST